jgi:phage/plasmid-like protein (TIGR03299 family)
MSHEVESMMFVGETPWHGLGTYCGDEGVDVDTALMASGLDWTVYDEPVHTTEGSVIPGFKAIRRDSDNSVLSINQESYRIFQNQEAFAFLDAIVAEDGGVKIETAGSLRMGKRIFIVAQTGSREVLPGDGVNEYMLVFTSHDGSLALTALPTSVRVVCNNTLQAARGMARGQKSGIKIRHTTRMDVQVADALSTLSDIRAAHAIQARFEETLAAHKMKATEWAALLDKIVPLPETRTARAEGKRDDLTHFYKEGIGTDIKGVRDTAWAALNAVTQFTTHQDARGDTTRLDRVLWGSGAALVTQTSEFLAEVVDFDGTAFAA